VKNNRLNKVAILIFLIIGQMVMAFGQTTYNDGSTLYITAGSGIYLDDMGFTNQTNVTDGSIDNEGSIYIDGDWNNNAASGVVFIDLNVSGTVYFTGSIAQALGGSRTTHFESLTINNTSSTGVTLDEPIEVHQALSMTDGILFTDATNLLTIVSGGSSNDGNAGSYVDGPMKKVGNTDFLFPTGDGTIWAPIEITSITGGTVTDEYTTEYHDAAAPFPNNLPASGINNVSVIEYWDISHTGGAASADLSLHWKDAARSDILDLTGGDLLAVHYNSTSSLWESRGSSICPGSTLGVGGTGCVTGTYTSYLHATFGSVSGFNPLPVTWLSFEGRRLNGIVKLMWRTATEINNDFFTIERSVNGFDFETIGTIPGSGNTTYTVSYEFSDERPVIGYSYYRIKQTDFDGQYDYSKIIALEFDPFGNSIFEQPEVMIYPNPANGEYLYINFNAPVENNEVEISIIDSAGKVHYHDNLELQNNQFDIPIERNILRRGMYMLKIKDQSGIYMGRFVIN
jgi:hypothetical protein